VSEITVPQQPQLDADAVEVCDHGAQRRAHVIFGRGTPPDREPAIRCRSSDLHRADPHEPRGA
jgi:hypothetical protein